MRYLMIHKIDESRPEAWNPSPEFQAAMGEFMQECAESGVLLAAEGVTQSKDGAVLRKTEGGGVTVTDSPTLPLPPGFVAHLSRGFSSPTPSYAVRPRRVPAGCPCSPCRRRVGP